MCLSTANHLSIMYTHHVKIPAICPIAVDFWTIRTKASTTRREFLMFNRQEITRHPIIKLEWDDATVDWQFLKPLFLPVRRRKFIKDVLFVYGEQRCIWLVCWLNIFNEVNPVRTRPRRTMASLVVFSLVQTATRSVPNPSASIALHTFDFTAVFTF